ncbi:MAG: chorismate mutase [Pseudohongiellaceae bacterium]|jgi:chorismate mutase
MAEKTLPEELLNAREKIDKIDSDLLSLLAERFALTFRVGEIKAMQSLESFDPQREAQKIEKLRAQSSGLSLNPDLVEQLFTDIMKEVVKNHQRFKQQKQQQ